MRAGIRTVLRASGSAIRNAAHPTMLSLVCAGALAPIAAIGAGAVPVALTAVLGSVGSGALSTVITRRVDRLRRGSDADLDESTVVAALAEVLDQVLDSDEAAAEDVRADLAALTQELSAVEVAIETAVAAANTELLHRVFSEFTALAHRDAANFGFVHEHLDQNTDMVLGVLHRMERLQRDAQASNQNLATEFVLHRREFRAFRAEMRDQSQAADSRSERSDRCPYPGLEAYGFEQADQFSGRERLTARLVERAGAALSGERMLLVTGPSGVGKSSLLQAGLLPAAASGDFADARAQVWSHSAIRPGEDPVGALALALAEGTGSDIAQVRQALMDDPARAGLYARQRARAVGESAGLLLVIDQFEELFTLTDDRAARRAFGAALLAIARDRNAAMLIVVGMRGDAIDRLSDLPELKAAMGAHRFEVEPMTGSELRQALTEPAFAIGLDFDDGLVEAILADLEGPAGEIDPAALPLLSLTGQALWRDRRGYRLTWVAYHDLGGVAEAVERHAERVFGELEQSGHGDTARELFRSLIHVTSNGELTRRIVALDQLGGAPSITEATAAFTEARLLTVSEAGAEIAHEILLTHWRRLQTWMDQHRSALTQRSQLLADAREWQQHDRDPAFLYRGSRLDAIEDARWNLWRHHPETFEPPGDLALAFLDEARSAAARRQRLRKVLAGSLAGLMVLLAATATAAYLAQRESAAQRDHALSQVLADRSLQAGAVDGRLARSLAAIAWELAPTDDAETALRQAHSNTRGGLVDVAAHRLTDIEFSPDGAYLVSLDDGGQLTVHDAADWTILQTFDLTDIGVDRGDRSLWFDPGGQHLAVLGTERLAMVDLSVMEVYGSISHTGGDPQRAAVSDDGSTVAMATSEVITVVATAGSSPGLEYEPGGHVAEVALNPEGTRLLVLLQHHSDEGFDLTLEMVDVSTGQVEADDLSSVPDEFASGDGLYWTTALDTNGTSLIPRDDITDGDLGSIIGVDGELTVLPDGETVMGRIASSAIGTWDIASQQQLSSLSDPVCAEQYVCLDAVRPDGGAVVVAEGRRLLLLDTALSEPISPPGVALTSTGDETFSAGLVLPDGGGVVACSDGGVYLWPEARDLGDEPEQLTDAPCENVTMDANASTIAVSHNQDNTVTIVELDSGATNTIELDGAPGATAFSSDGSHLAVGVMNTSSLNSSVQIWDTGTWTRESTIGNEGLAGWITALHYIEDDATLLVGAWGAAYLLDAGTGNVTTDRRFDAVFTLEPVPSEGGAMVRTVDAVWFWDLDSDTWDLRIDTSEDDDPHMGIGSALSADGAYLATSGASSDGAVRIWDFATGRMLQSISGNRVENDVAFSPDGTTLAGFGTQMQTWDLSFLYRPYEAVCDRIDTGLTAEEWAHNIPELDYESVSACT